MNVQRAVEIQGHGEKKKWSGMFRFPSRAAPYKTGDTLTSETFYLLANYFCQWLYNTQYVNGDAKKIYLGWQYLEHAIILHVYSSSFKLPSHQCFSFSPSLIVLCPPFLTLSHKCLHVPTCIVTHTLFPSLLMGLVISVCLFHNDVLHNLVCFRRDVA